VGVGQGSYLPIRLIPLPERNQVGNIVVDYSPIEAVNLNLEFAASSFDRNIFSDKDDEDNDGYATNLNLNIRQLELNFLDTDLGKLSSSYRDRFIDKQFKSIDRINEIEFERNYNAVSGNDESEILREFKLNYSPIEAISLSGQYGFLKRGNNFSSERVISNLKTENYNNIDFEYNYDIVTTKKLIDETDWLRQNGRISYSFWKLKPGFEFRSENKEDLFKDQDSLLITSQNFNEYSPFILISLSNGLSFTAKYTYNRELAPEKGKFIDESKTYSHTYSLVFREYKEISSDLDFSFRKKKYSEEFAAKGFGDNESIQIRSQNRLRFFDRLVEGTIFYQTSSERSAKLERVFVRVPKGTGGYSYLGDLNNNGLAEENEFAPDPFEGDFIQTTVPTDELFPVIDLKLNTRWKLDLKRYFNENDFFSSVMGAISSETNYRVEEKSRIEETEKIYLLNFKYFLNDSTTIRGFNFFQQDVHIWKNQRDLSFRFRFSERQSINQFSSGIESAYSKSRSIKMKFRMV
ncbi:MAG: hypothetical protein R3250_17585, partial [Melioribacteraceae bacterium]|nr:hypothetical protein [Melioribacteraceae bacterium]